MQHAMPCWLTCTHWVPSNSIVSPGEMFTVALEIEDAENLGAFQFDMAFDPAVVQVEAVTLGDFLGSTGRSTAPLGPEIDNAAGTVTLGGFTFGRQPGAGGDGVLAIVTLAAQEMGSNWLALDNVQVTATLGRAQAVTVQSGSVMVGLTRSIYFPLIAKE